MVASCTKRECISALFASSALFSAWTHGGCDADATVSRGSDWSFLLTTHVPPISRNPSLLPAVGVAAAIRIRDFEDQQQKGKPAVVPEMRVATSRKNLQSPL